MTQKHTDTPLHTAHFLSEKFILSKTDYDISANNPLFQYSYYYNIIFQDEFQLNFCRFTNKFCV